MVADKYIILRCLGRTDPVVQDYAAVEPDLWLFAVLGTVAAMIQLLVQTALARSHRSAAWWVWAAQARPPVTTLSALHGSRFT